MESATPTSMPAPKAATDVEGSQGAWQVFLQQPADPLLPLHTPTAAITTTPSLRNVYLKVLAYVACILLHIAGVFLCLAAVCFVAKCWLLVATWIHTSIPGTKLPLAFDMAFWFTCLSLVIVIWFPFLVWDNEAGTVLLKMNNLVGNNDEGSKTATCWGGLKLFLVAFAFILPFSFAVFVVAYAVAWILPDDEPTGSKVFLEIILLIAVFSGVAGQLNNEKPTIQLEQNPVTMV